MFATGRRCAHRWYVYPLVGSHAAAVLRSAAAFGAPPSDLPGVSPDLLGASPEPAVCPGSQLTARQSEGGGVRIRRTRVQALA